MSAAPRTLAVLALAALAAAAPARAEKVRDNLFLLEEAYNQEPGVVQHIQAFQFSPGTRAWSYSFTEEVPVPTDLHQLSVTVPAGRPGERGAAVGDLMLNYRLQALGVGGKGRLALAPRLSLVLPTGDWKTGAGRGVLGVQLNLPASLELGERLVAHLNAGMTVTPGARAPGGRSESALDANAGFALVWFPVPWLNPLVEVGYLSTRELRDSGSARTNTLFVNPGFRVAIDVGGLQVVPGVSAPVQVSAGGVEVSLLGYLSFEHPLWSQPPAREQVADAREAVARKQK